MLDVGVIVERLVSLVGVGVGANHGHLDRDKYSFLGSGEDEEAGGPGSPSWRDTPTFAWLSQNRTSIGILSLGHHQNNFIITSLRT
ncbi:hypothetical protein HAX54_000395 [Datura stramonium]|uniref:Uncharacterized protein n=1 Tax=Datura stramonium TaxID=4076 RepID=A0ABS8T0Y0_DATST|nr:hypothetical protein [Datura stramonium]